MEFKFQTGKNSKGNKLRTIEMNSGKKILFITQRRKGAKFKEALLLIYLCELSGFARDLRIRYQLIWHSGLATSRSSRKMTLRLTTPTIFPSL